MEFKDILNQLTQWLQTDSRVSRSAIKRQFKIDDDYLEDLIDALTYAHSVEADERGLVWRNSNTPKKNVDVSGFEAGHGRAERRHLTVMFCDLADSTSLSQSLDPEDLRHVIRLYQQKASESIHNYGGHVAQYLGDGLLVYFGWPKAHEDDPRRAVLSALEIIESIEADANPALKEMHNVELSLRIGIHTGNVVVGEMGGYGKYESLATGDTVNIAARLEAIANNNCVVVSDTTAKLISRHFDLKDLGPHQLKGVEIPVNVFEVSGVTKVKSVGHLENKGSRHALVGRDEETGLLLRCWGETRRGHGRVVLVSGIAGIGKSTLVDNLRQTVIQEGSPCITVRCSSFHQNSVLFPVARLIESALGLDTPMSDSDKIEVIKQELKELDLSDGELSSILARLVSVDDPHFADRYNTYSPQKIKQITLDTIVSWLFARTLQKPNLVVWEDLHWADPSTLELIGMILEQIPTVAMLSVMTYRSEFIPPWRHRSHITPITLNRLEHQHAEAMIANLVGQISLPQQVVEHIVRKTDGVPLFLEELTKMILDSGILSIRDGKYSLKGPLDSIAIPNTLQDSLLARLDQLNTAKEIAQIASALGREFNYNILKAVYPHNEAALDEGLSQLVEAELLYIRGRIPEAVFTFKHALLQDAAYATLLKSTRQELHARIADHLISGSREITKSQPEVLAHHLTVAGKYAKAIEYWLMASALAKVDSSHAESIAHASKGLSCAKQIQNPRDRKEHEVQLYLALGPSILATKGYADDAAEKVYNKAKELGTELDNREAMYVSLFGLSAFHLVRAEHQAALELADDMRSSISDPDDPYYSAIKLANGMPLFCLSRFEESANEFKSGVNSYTSEVNDVQIKSFGIDTGVFCRSFGAPVVWQLGQLDLAKRWADEAVEMAVQLNHPFSRSIALAYASMSYQLLGDVNTTQMLAAEAISVSTNQKFPYYLGWGLVMHGWAIGKLGNYETGLSQIREGLSVLTETGTRRSFPYYYSLEAEVHAHHGNFEAALHSVQTGLAEANAIQEFWWHAELMRMRGDFIIHRTLPSEEIAQEALSCYKEAIDISRKNKAVMQELRAICSLIKTGIPHPDLPAKRLKTHLTDLVKGLEGDTRYPDVAMVYDLLEN